MASMLWNSMLNSEMRQAGFRDKNLPIGTCTATTSLVNKTVIVTGGTAGIGKECVRDFVKRGAKVFLPCRNIERGTLVKNEIEMETRKIGQIIIMEMELSSLDSVRNFVAKFKERETRLDILLNNAGVMFTRNMPSHSIDDHEIIMATNHLGHFLLTYLLIDVLKRSAPSRIVNVSSSAHFGATDMYYNDFDIKHFNICSRPSEFLLYARSKAANVMFSKVLNSKYADVGVTSYSCHPGIVETELSRNVSPILDWCTYGFLKCLKFFIIRSKYKTSFQGAQTSLFCCLEENLERESGNYFSECQVQQMSTLCRDEEECQRLWEISCDMTGIEHNWN